MHLVRSFLVVTLVTPLALAGPKGNSFFRRTGDGMFSPSSVPVTHTALSRCTSLFLSCTRKPANTVARTFFFAISRILLISLLRTDDTDKDLKSTISQSRTETLSLTSSLVLISGGQSSTVPPKDLPSTTSLPSTPDKDKDTPTSTVSTSGKDEPISTTSTQDKDAPSSSTSNKDTTTSVSSISDKDDKSTTSLLAKDQTTSSSVPAKDLSSPTSVALFTSLSSAPESIQEVNVTDVVYTTLTTCSITNTITSGSTAIEKVTTTISTLTLTSTSTVCTKCVAPPKSKPETPSTSAGSTITSSFAASIIHSLTQLPSSPSSEASPSSETKISSSSGPPVISYSITLPRAPLTTAPAKPVSSQPETSILGTVVSSGTGLIFPSLRSLSVSASSITSPLIISGYSIVPPPKSIAQGPGPFGNASSTIIPVFSASLLGNAYGGGFIATPSVYASKLSFPSGPPGGYAPGYGFSSTPETSPSNAPPAAVIPQLSTIPAIGVPISAGIETFTTALANTLASESVAFIPSALVNGAVTPLTSAIHLTVGQIPSAQFSPTILTPVVSANGLTSLAVVPTPPVLTSLAVGPSPINLPSSLVPSVNGFTPVMGANGVSSVVVVPSSVVGLNGLTSLAVFSTPIAAAHGLTSPAVVLTPVVGANGLTSLAVLATPVVGANGLMSLAVGLASEQAATSPSSEYAMVGAATAASGSQVGVTAPPLIPTPAVSDILPASSNYPANGSVGNASVHVSLNPTAIAEFQGSAGRLTLGCGVGLMGFVIFLFLL